MNPKQPTLYLIRGIPGSGKSTLASSMQEAMGTCLFEADHYFVQPDGTYKFDPSMLKEAHQECQNATRFALAQGVSVIVSNTSTTEAEVQTYQDIANQMKANFVSIIVENRHGGVNSHDVPADTIQRMKQRFSVKL
jgi:predicted kinase